MWAVRNPKCLLRFPSVEDSDSPDGERRRSACAKGPRTTRRRRSEEQFAVSLHSTLRGLFSLLNSRSKCRLERRWQFLSLPRQHRCRLPRQVSAHGFRGLLPVIRLTRMFRPLSCMTSPCRPSKGSSSPASLTDTGRSSGTPVAEAMAYWLMMVVAVLSRNSRRWDLDSGAGWRCHQGSSKYSIPLYLV